MDPLSLTHNFFLAKAAALPEPGPDASAPAAMVPPTPEQLALLPHDSLKTNLNASIWSLIGISAVFLGLRLYCKVSRHAGMWWDDYILIASWICITVESILLTYATTLGYGLHIWDWPFDMDNGIKMLLVINSAGTLSLTAAIWSKTSFALTMLRLTKGPVKAAIWFVIISMNIAMGLSALFIWVQCSPVQKSWNPFIEGTCWPPSVLVNYDIFSAAYSAFMDVVLALIPWSVIWGLQMKRHEKIGVALAMSCGVFAGITAIVKTTKIPAMLSPDPIEGVNLFIWGNAESCVTIVAASLPVLRVLLRDVKTSAKKYYLSNGTSQSDSRSRVRGQENTVMVTAGHSVPRSFNSPKLDDSSDRSYLDLEGRDGMGRIMRTNEFAIEYQDRK